MWITSEKGGNEMGERKRQENLGIKIKEESYMEEIKEKKEDVEKNQKSP